MTLLFTLVWLPWAGMIKRHYRFAAMAIEKATEDFESITEEECKDVPALERNKPTAVVLVGESFGAGMHTLLWVRRLFPNAFTNFVFVSVGEVDSGNFGEEEAWQPCARAEKPC